MNNSYHLNGNKILNPSLNSYLEADPALLILYQYA